MSGPQSERLSKRNGIWYVTVYDHHGQRRRFSTRCRDRKAAERQAREIERAAVDPDHEAAQATLTRVLQEFVADRIEQAEAGRKSFATAEFYRQKAGHWIRILGDDGNTPFMITRLHARHVDLFISQRRSEGAAEGTIQKELTTLRAALKIAIRRGLWNGQIEAVMPSGFAPAYRPRTRYLTQSELQLLLAQLTPDHAARVAFIVATSACLGETDRARLEHISDDLTDVFIDGTKRAARRRDVPIVSPQQKSLLAYAIKHAQGTDFLFEPWANIRRDLQRACERAEIPKCSPNDLRRTCATWLHAQGATPDLIAPLMGHADSRMVERVYGRLSLDDHHRRLAESMGVAIQPAVSTVSNVCQTGADPVGRSGHTGPLGQRTGRKTQSNQGGVVPSPGFEPGTRGFSIHCSTN